ncbi:MAG: diguanylate cyclase [Actinomycetota bacterium]
MTSTSSPRRALLADRSLRLAVLSGPLGAVAPRVRRAVAALFALAVAATALYAVANGTGTGWAWLDGVESQWGATIVQGIVLVAVVMRLVVLRESRTAWAFLAAALALWVVADVWWALTGFPTVSVVDGVYGVSYAAFYLSLGLLLRGRGHRLGLSTWLDGVIAGTCVIAASATFILPAVANGGGTALEVAVNLAYPVADLVLVVIAVVGMALARWRPSPAWLVLAAGQVISGATDSIYAYEVAASPVVPDWLLFTLWCAGFVVLGLAPWLPAVVPHTHAVHSVRVLLAPAGFALLATALLAREAISGARSVGLAFAAITVIAVVLRMGLFHREVARLTHGLARATAQAATDPLTGLLNHRAFHERLGQEVDRAQREGAPLSLVLLDLDHFKLVNDTRGHQAGDALLVEVAARLRTTARSHDVLGRVGGEEFAWLLPRCPEVEAVEAADRARVAVRNSGIELDGINATTISAGVASLDRAASAADLYRLADGALYWAKAHGRDKVVSYAPEVVTALSASEEAQQLARSQALNAVNVLARAVDAKDPYTQRHSERVADLAIGLATALGWDIPQIIALREAALVHDVGKIGVPDTLLAKHDKLTDEEWELMRAHPALGAQIVSGVLAPDQVAWVRGHHERHDGGGYPDGLAGDDLPLGAAVIAVADAWDAMRSDRPYRAAIDVDEAMRRCLEGRGTQFRPEVVDALARLHDVGALDAGGGEARVREVAAEGAI